MADDHNQRPYRSNEPLPRTSPGATPAPSSDPLAELARLIGQSDPFAEFGRDSERRAAQPPAPPAPPAAPTYGSNDYYAASTAPAAPAHEAGAPPYGAPAARQPYANPSYAAGADLYHTDNQVPGYQPNPYQPNAMHADEEDDLYDDIPPPRRRVGVMAIAAVFALAVIGTAGAFGYRALFGSSGSNLPPPVIKADTQPSKIVPANANKASNKLITDRVSDHAQDEKLVSREEKPVDVTSTPPDSAPQAQNNGQPAPVASGVIAGEPRKIHTITIRPDQLASDVSQPGGATATAPAPPAPSPRMDGPSPIRPAAPRVASTAPAANTPEPPARPAETRAAPVERRAAAPARNAPLSLNPNAVDAAPAPAAPAPRAPMRTAAAAAPMPIAQTANAASKPGSGGSGSYVQVSSQRSEADAQSAFHSLQAKYPSQLGNRQPVIRKVELGEKGTYYRAMVGPLAGNEASELCSGIKSAGGSCLIQRN
jgi:hypothetical protein